MCDIRPVSDNPKLMRCVNENAEGAGRVHTDLLQIVDLPWRPRDELFIRQDLAGA